MSTTRSSKIIIDENLIRFEEEGYNSSVDDDVIEKWQLVKMLSFFRKKDAMALCLTTTALSKMTVGEYAILLRKRDIMALWTSTLSKNGN